VTFGLHFVLKVASTNELIEKYTAYKKSLAHASRVCVGLQTMLLCCKALKSPLRKFGALPLAMLNTTEQWVSTLVDPIKQTGLGLKEARANSQMKMHLLRHVGFLCSCLTIAALQPANCTAKEATTDSVSMPATVCSFSKRPSKPAVSLSAI
jgi:hypothetical protein